MQLAQYRIVRRIGAGGMAEVFLAQSTGAAGFSRNVAIKTIIAAGAAQESIGLFLDEARVAATLSHANIIQTLDLGFENDTLFIAMEYVPGPPLSRIVKELKDRGRTMPPHLVAHIGAKVANALDFAHRRVKTAQGQALAMVHRDISPQNILVSRSGVIKLMDFGVARASIQMHKTKTGQVRGKAAYMAPEQVRAQALDGRTDMFALGLVMYEMLTAYRPFQRNNEIASMRAIIGEDVPPITDRNPDVPAPLGEVIHKALRRVPDERWAHCGEMEDQLLKTIKSHRSSSLDEELVQLLVELFGQENFADDLPDVEAWQPTRASMDTPVTPRFKVPGSGLSPEIAAMLGQTPQTPVAVPMPELNGINTPSATAVPRAFTQAPQRLPPGYNPQTAPQMMGEGSNPNGTLQNGMMQMNSTGQIQGMLSGTAPVLSPYSLQSVPGMTPASSPSLTTAGQSGNLRLVVAVLSSFLAGIALMLFLRNTEPPEAESHPLPTGAPQPSIGAPSAPSVAPSASKSAEPSATPNATLAPRTPKPSSRPSPSASSVVSAAPLATESPKPSAPASTKPAVNRETLMASAITLKSKAQARGNAELAGKLGTVANDLMMGKEPTPAMITLIKESERELP